MALTRGPKSHCPCPKCLVPKAEMAKGEMYPLRTTKTMKEVYKKAKEADTVKACEEIVKAISLRFAKVCKTLTLFSAYS